MAVAQKALLDPAAASGAELDPAAVLDLRRALAVDPNHQGARDDLEKVDRKLAH